MNSYKELVVAVDKVKLMGVAINAEDFHRVAEEKRTVAIDGAKVAIDNGDIVEAVRQLQAVKVADNIRNITPGYMTYKQKRVRLKPEALSREIEI